MRRAAAHDGILAIKLVGRECSDTRQWLWRHGATSNFWIASSLPCPLNRNDAGKHAWVALRAGPRSRPADTRLINGAAG